MLNGHKMLAKLIKESGWSLRALAREMGTVNDTTINRWITGESEPSASDFVKLCRAIRIDASAYIDNMINDEPKEDTDIEKQGKEACGQVKLSLIGVLTDLDNISTLNQFRKPSSLYDLGNTLIELGDKLKSVAHKIANARQPL